MNRIDRNIVKIWALNSLALWLVSLTASAQIYKSVDENGVVTFSDVPPATKARIKSTVVKPSVTNSMPGSSPLVTSPKATTIDESAELSAPMDDGKLLALYLDDEMVDGPQASAVWTLSYLIRDSHTLQVRRLSIAGETLGESEKISVFILRPSVLRAAPR